MGEGVRAQTAFMDEFKSMGFGGRDKNGEQNAKSQKSNSPQSDTTPDRTPDRTNAKKRQIDISYEPINRKANVAENGKKPANARNQRTQTNPQQKQRTQTNPQQNQRTQTNPQQNQRTQTNPQQKQRTQTNPQQNQRTQTNPQQNQRTQTNPQQNQRTQTNPNRQSNSKMANARRRQQSRQKNAAAAGYNPASGNKGQPPSREAVRQSNGRTHKRRHKKNYTLHYIFLSILLTIVTVSLSLTVLFNVSEILIKDYPDVNEQEIIASSTLKIGDNLVRMNAGKIEAKILNENIMLDSVSVKRKFPSGVEITLDLSEPKFGIKNESEYYYFSKSGRYFTASMERKGLVFDGIDVSGIALGEYVTKAAADGLQMIKELHDAIEEAKIQHITYIDIRDISSIKLYYKDEIEIIIGGISLVNYKLEKAKGIIAEKMVDGVIGQLDVQVHKKAFFRPVDFDAPW